ncbi:MAG: type II toxin-antitoxin system PemK/MazF family toxin [archaeon]
MTSGTSFEQREIVLTPFPFSDLSNIKQRPVLILSNNEYNYKTEDLLVCGLTSTLKDTEYSVLIDNKNLEAGMIPLKSRIKVDKIFTLEQSLFKKKLGKLDKETFEKVKEELMKLI